MQRAPPYSSGSAAATGGLSCLESTRSAGHTVLCVLVWEVSVGSAWPSRLQAAAALEAECQEIYQENQSLNRQQAALSKELNALKGAANALTDEAADEKFKLMEVRQEEEALRSQIVEVRSQRATWAARRGCSARSVLSAANAAPQSNECNSSPREARHERMCSCCACTVSPVCLSCDVQSPEKLQQLLETLQAEVENERTLLADAERHSRDLHTRLDIISKVGVPSLDGREAAWFDQTAACVGWGGRQTRGGCGVYTNQPIDPTVAFGLQEQRARCRVGLLLGLGCY
jgi:flagellar biosynthesis GTPase FlhF